MDRPPLPEPDYVASAVYTTTPDRHYWQEPKMHAYAAAVSAADNAALRGALQEYVNHDLLKNTVGKMNAKARAALKGAIHE